MRGSEWVRGEVLRGASDRGIGMSEGRVSDKSKG